MRKLKDNSAEAVHIHETALLLQEASKSPVTRHFAREVQEYLEEDVSKVPVELLLKPLYRLSTHPISKN